MKPEQITAWALNELSAEERARIDDALRENPRAVQDAEVTKDFCDFLLTELRDESLALTPEQRERLQSTETPRNVIQPSFEAKPVRWNFVSRFGPLAAAAACGVLGTLLMMQVMEPKKAVVTEVAPKESEFRVSMANTEAARVALVPAGGPPSMGSVLSSRLVDPMPANQLASGTGNLSLVTTSPGAADRTLADQIIQGGNGAKIAGVQPGKAQFATGGDLLASTASGLRNITTTAGTLGRLDSGTVSLGGNAGGTRSMDPNLIFSGAGETTGSLVTINGSMPPAGGGVGQFSGGAQAANSSASGLSSTVALGRTPIATATSNLGAVNSTSGTGSIEIINRSGPVMEGITLSAATTGPAGGGALQLSAGVLGTTSSTRLNSSDATLNSSATQFATAAPPSATQPGLMLAGNGSTEGAVVFNGAAPSSTTTTLAAGTVVNGPPVNNPVPHTYHEHRLAEQEVAGRAKMVGGFEEKGLAETLVRRQTADSSESYTAIVENELKDVLREPLSTFSIDVDTAAYANVRRFLNQNMLPPKDAVRIEELVNYFPTNEEGPTAEAKEPFATRVELAACPWQPRHKLARISIQGREIEKSSKASNLVFLVDVSGSMNDPQKLPLVQQSLRMLAEQLGESDRVAMVTYASGTQVVLPPTGGERRSQIVAAVDQLRAGGSTNGAGGLQLAYEQAVAGFVQGGINRVILCTDGDFNVGISDPAQLEKFIADKARSGVFLSVLGFGSGNLKDRTMETLANKGNGNYAYIDGLGEARKVLVEQMSGTLVTIAKDVKIQIEFNPAMVRSYRLIGYENRLLAKEDFNDDTKDAGEIGSGHSVVALYELLPANLQPGEEPARIVDTLKYQTLASPMPDGTMPKLSNTAQTTKEVMTVKLRYKQPEGETSQKLEVPVMDVDKAITAASAEFKFSAAVAAFGLMLRDSGYKGQLTWGAVRALALEGKGSDKLGYRGEFLQLIDKAAGLKGTRP